MDVQKLQAGNKLLMALNTIKQIISTVENLFGLTDEQKAQTKQQLQAHHDDLQKQLDAL